MSGLVHTDRPKLGPAATVCNSIPLLHYKERHILTDHSIFIKAHFPSGYLHLTIRQTIKPLPHIYVSSNTAQVNMGYKYTLPDGDMEL